MGSVKKNSHQVLLGPRITEKAALAGTGRNCVVFEVHPKANKIEIARAVERVFEAKVKMVRTVNVMGKIKRVGQMEGRKRAWKKAYVFLKEGSKIDVLEGVN